MTEEIKRTDCCEICGDPLMLADTDSVCNVCKQHHRAHDAGYLVQTIINQAVQLQTMTSVRDKAFIALKCIQAQFAGYALRVAPNDSGNDIILNTIEEAIAEIERTYQ